MRNAEKRELRESFNKRTGKNYKTIALIKRYLKIDDTREAYEFLKNEREKELFKKEEVYIKQNVEVRSAQFCDSEYMNNFRLWLQEYKGKHIVVEYRDGENIILKKEYNVPVERFGAWFGKIRLNDWGFKSGETIFTHNDLLGFVYIYEEKLGLTSERIRQVFRDGVSHCIFEPIKRWALEKLDSSESKRTKQRYQLLLKDLKMFEEKYSDGVPEDCFPEICNKLQIDISIELPFGKTKVLECESIRKRLKLFRFVNTRLNHVEVNQVVLNDKPEVVSKEELKQIVDDLNSTGEHYTYSMNNKNVCGVNTLNRCYALGNDFQDACFEFEKETTLNECRLDDIDDKEISQFVALGTNYNGTIDFVDTFHYSKMKTGELLQFIDHIDMTKAYTQFKKSSFYAGFLGKITDFRKVDKVVGVGLYKITDLDFSESLFERLNSVLKIFIDNNVYSSPELAFLDKARVKYRVVCGCWGVKPIDFEFNEKMTILKDDGVPYYSKWTGRIDSHLLERTMWMNCDDDFVNVLREQDESVIRHYNNGSVCIATKKKHNYHLGHITAFIVAYQRLNILEQLGRFNYDDLVRVCVDGIYFKRGATFEMMSPFEYKRSKLTLQNGCGSSYVSVAEKCELIVCGGDSREHFARELHLGEGGSGKTHHNLTDRGLVKVGYLAPSWKLARAKRNELGIEASVWARLLSDDPERINEIRKWFNVLIVDEISMMNENEKRKIFERYSDMKIIMCGDLGYQLPCIVGEEAGITGFDNIVHHNKDYRCACPLLKDIKQSLREMINDGCDVRFINKWVVDKFRELGRVINEDKLKELYDVNDMILVGTNDLKDKYTKMFESLKKYYVIENNNLYSNGDVIVGEKPEKTRAELRHGFTTHSVQGETCLNKVFIDSTRMFDPRMFYTAISRAKKLNQIFVIAKHLEMPVKRENKEPENTESENTESEQEEEHTDSEQEEEHTDSEQEEEPIEHKKNTILNKCPNCNGRKCKCTKITEFFKISVSG